MGLSQVSEGTQSRKKYFVSQLIRRGRTALEKTLSPSSVAFTFSGKGRSVTLVEGATREGRGRGIANVGKRQDTQRHSLGG